MDVVGVWLVWKVLADTWGHSPVCMWDTDPFSLRIDEWRVSVPSQLESPVSHLLCVVGTHGSLTGPAAAGFLCIGCLEPSDSLEPGV